MEWINDISLQSPFFDKEIAEFGWILRQYENKEWCKQIYLYKKNFLKAFYHQK